MLRTYRGVSRIYYYVAWISGTWGGFSSTSVGVPCSRVSSSLSDRAFGSAVLWTCFNNSRLGLLDRDHLDVNEKIHPPRTNNGMERPSWKESLKSARTKCRLRHTDDNGSQHDKTYDGVKTGGQEFLLISRRHVRLWELGDCKRGYIYSTYACSMRSLCLYT